MKLVRWNDDQWRRVRARLLPCGESGEIFSFRLGSSILRYLLVLALILGFWDFRFTQLLHLVILL